VLLLENRVAVVYGAGGSIGGAVARGFAREGARLFLAGRTGATVERVAAEIASAGGSAVADEVDALDEAAVDRHADRAAERAGGIDISVNTIRYGDVHGTSLLEMDFDDFARPVFNAVRSQFFTARAAARHMAARGSGVILAVTATTARMRIPEIGGTGVAFDAIESLCRQWATELGPKGVRVAWLRTTGVPEAFGDADYVAPAYGTGKPMTRAEHIAWMEDRTLLGRLTTLADIGNAAAFLASDMAGSITASGLNLSAGSAPD
jgi:3-oxoacyl-[acyl-carrier protein] reductase